MGHIGHNSLITLEKSSKALSQSKVSSRAASDKHGVGYGQASTDFYNPSKEQTMKELPVP
jgi:hypothetical protein